MEVAKGAVVTLNYTLSLDDGEVLGEAQDSTEYLHGYDNIIPGLERALEGAQPGERRGVTLEPADAYGEHDEDRLITVPADSMPDYVELEAGRQITAQTSRGYVELTVLEVNDDNVVLDGNHPLAGKRLHFDVEIMDIRDAACHELSQGFPGPQRSPFG